MQYAFEKNFMNFRIHVRSNDIYFKTGLIELARRYFVAQNKILYIIETNTFTSRSHMKRHLQAIKAINFDFLILVSSDLPFENYYVWSLKRDAPLESWIESIDTMNFFSQNIDSVIATCD